MPEAETGQAVQVLDLLLEYFGEQDERRTRDRYDDGDGRRCLVGALSYLRGKHRIPSESAECFLHEAMKQGLPHRRGGLVYFNDRCRSFAELRSAIVEARAIAVGEAERERGAAAVERWLLAEMERERATKAAAGDKRMTYILSLRAPGSQFQGSSFAESQPPPDDLPSRPWPDAYGTENDLGIRPDQSECHHSFQSAEEDGAHSVTGQV
jgi:hypothetical protein